MSPRMRTVVLLVIVAACMCATAAVLHVAALIGPW